MMRRQWNDGHTENLERRLMVPHPKRLALQLQLISEFTGSLSPQTKPTQAVMTSSSSSKKLILVTGANAGLGLDCSLALAKQENTHVILAGRSQQRIDDAVTKTKAVAAASSIVEGALVDLANLASVQQLARAFIQRDLKFYTIVCNAGVQLQNLTLTSDGYETTVGVNHIAHCLLVALLRDRTQHVLMISSETHDPAEVNVKPAIDMTDLDAMARGTQPYHGQMFYARSKLCNVLFTKEFARRFPNGPSIAAYTPGFTPDTEFFREYNVVVRFFLKKAISLYVAYSGGRVSTSQYSGGFMARIASAGSWDANGWTSGDYIRVDEVWEASPQARDPALAKALWDKTEAWIKPFLV